MYADGKRGERGGEDGWRRMGGEEARALQGHLGTNNGGNTGLCAAASRQKNPVSLRVEYGTPVPCVYTGGMSLTVSYSILVSNYLGKPSAMSGGKFSPP